MGISDVQKMVVTVMKTQYKKQKPKTIQYRNYKHFHEQSFNSELNNMLLKIDINNAELQEFNEFFYKFLISMLREKLFEKKLCTDLDFGTNFWEREQINLRSITNNQISACYIKLIENISPIWTRKL